MHSIVKALKRPIISPKLCKLAHLRRTSHVPTQWSSSAEMLHRHIKLKEPVTELDAVHFDVTLPANKENKATETLCKKYSELNSVTKLLQKSSTTCATVRAVFDEVIKDYSDRSGSLGASASIVHDTVFERVLVRLQNQRFESLSPEEKYTVTNLMSSQNDMMNRSSNFSDLRIVERAIKRPWFAESSISCYVDTRFILPTSNACEQLFSKAGCTLPDRIISLIPANLE